MTCWIRSGTPLSKASTPAAKTSPGSPISFKAGLTISQPGSPATRKAVEMGLDAVVQFVESQSL